MAPGEGGNSHRLAFDVYGRFVLVLVREGDVWRVFRKGEGTLRPEPGLVIPGDIAPGDLCIFLDDHYHELAAAGQEIRQLDR
ncbi:DUF7661 family protein [Microbulbifer hainanensis]|uniref:DUF7661 family protein n=1 Tax=Microbulbifer hainanensis TaxID=2735675 RepID=UPI0018663672|nr:hypothetical protein [Microbulbifer hainanensis]